MICTMDMGHIQWTSILNVITRASGLVHEWIQWSLWSWHCEHSVFTPPHEGDKIMLQVIQFDNVTWIYQHYRNTNIQNEIIPTSCLGACIVIGQSSSKLQVGHFLYFVLMLVVAISGKTNWDVMTCPAAKMPAKHVAWTEVTTITFYHARVWHLWCGWNFNFSNSIIYPIE